MKSARCGVSMTLLFCTGCLPNLQTTDPAGPLQEYQFVKIEGDRLTGAMISFKAPGVAKFPVGAAAAAVGDPTKRRDVVVPELTATSVSATIEGRDFIGADTLTRVVNNVPKPGPAFLITGFTGTAALGGDFIINGDGVFPGAGAGTGLGKVSLLTPFAGPVAVAHRHLPLPLSTFTPSHTTFLWDKTYQIHFDPGGLTPGTYNIHVTNAPQYGGGPTVFSTNTVVVP